MARPSGPMLPGPAFGPDAPGPAFGPDAPRPGLQARCTRPGLQAGCALHLPAAPYARPHVPGPPFPSRLSRPPDGPGNTGGHAHAPDLRFALASASREGQ